MLTKEIRLGEKAVMEMTNPNFGLMKTGMLPEDVRRSISSLVSKKEDKVKELNDTVALLRHEMELAAKNAKK
jgi:hypothetical protein